MPAQSLILEEINSTYIILALHTWQTGGCLITFYDVTYQVLGDSLWQTADSHIIPNTASHYAWS